MNNKLLGKMGILLCAFLCSSNFTVFANTTSSPITYDDKLVYEEATPYLNQIFNVYAKQGEWTLIHSTNNWLNENVKITPTGFGVGIESVDIFVSWSNGSKQWNNVQIDETNTAVVYWNNSDYRVYVKPNGADGNVNVRVNDRG